VRVCLSVRPCVSVCVVQRVSVGVRAPVCAAQKVDVMCTCSCLLFVVTPGQAVDMYLEMPIHLGPLLVCVWYRYHRPLLR